MDRILDRHQYDAKMITNIEVMAAYFVDLFYNHLYFEGKKLKVNGSVPSVTEGYKHALNAFIKSMSNAKLYKKAVIGIHQYFMNYTSFTTISFAKCVDRLAANFVPLDYYSSLNNTQKMSVLRLVINQAIKNFTKKIVNDHLNKIIDHHKEQDNVRLLQDELIDCFLLEREGVYQRFVSTQTQTNQNETVNRLVAEKMQREIKNLILEKIQLKKENNALKHIIIKKSKELAQFTENAGNMEATINELNGEIQGMQVQRSRYTEVNHSNIGSVLDSFQEPESPRSAVSERFEQSAFVAMDAAPITTLGVVSSEPEPEPQYSSNSASPRTPQQIEPQIVSSNPTPFEQPKKATKPPSRFGTLAVPKKKRPSSNLGDGVQLDDFY
jgi:hypothetical protein